MLQALGRTSSINVRTVLWTCDEIGVRYERSDWGLGFRPTQSPESLALNPNALVPAIVEDGGCFVVSGGAASRNAAGMWSPMSLEPAVIERAARRGTAALNKAFTKDNDSADDNDGAPAVPPLPAGAKNYLTPQGYARLRAELLNLLDSERPKVVEVVSWAAKNGDRSENGDYLYGKKRLREIDRRIRFLTLRLDLAEVVDPSLHFGHDQVFFGATVTYVDEAGAERTITIKGIDEVEHLGGEVSWISPVARALLKARVGDEVLLATPNGSTRIEVVAVCYPAPPGD